MGTVEGHKRVIDYVNATTAELPRIGHKTGIYNLDLSRQATRSNAKDCGTVYGHRPFQRNKISSSELPCY